jgi:polysaccharide biosynthesis protein VpsM
MTSFLSHHFKYLQAYTTLLFVVFLCSDTVAQEAAAIYVGPFDVTPTLNINAENNDNVFSESAGSETTATLTQFIPAVSAIADDGVIRYSLAYQLENGRYNGVDNNNYTDHQLDAKVDWRPDIRHLIELGVTESRGHDERSVDSVTGIDAPELDKTKERELAANYTFGSEGARGRLIIGFTTSSLRYTTNRSETNVLESDTDILNASFSVGVGANSRAVLEVIDSKNTFQANAANNRDDRSYLAGFEWKVSELFSGNVRVGQSQSTLVNASEKTSSTVGEASIVWSPIEYSVFTLTANQAVENSENNVGNFVDRSALSLGWTHQINGQLTAAAILARQTDDFVNANRSDTSNEAQVQLRYAFRRWLELGVGVTRTERTSTDQALDFDNSKIVVSVKASL